MSSAYSLLKGSDNYAVWAALTRSELRAAGLWRYATGEIPKPSPKAPKPQLCDPENLEGYEIHVLHEYWAYKRKMRGRPEPLPPITITKLNGYRQGRLKERLRAWSEEYEDESWGAARKDWDMNDARASCIIMGTCCDSVLRAVHRLKTAHEMWAFLERWYEVSDEMRAWAGVLR